MINANGQTIDASYTCISVLITLLTIQPLAAQDVTLDWAFGMGSGTYDQGNDMAVDVFGDVYVTGLFSGWMDADPGPDTLNIGALGNVGRSAFIQKLNAAGDLIWAHGFGGVGDGTGTSVTTDAAGNVYMTGSFSTTVDFDPGPGVHDLVCVGFPDMFILKLDVAGNFVWARSIGAYDGALGSSVTLDPAGNVLIAGSFKSTVDFDPGPGTSMRTSNGWDDIFLLKLDPAGSFVWANTLGGWYIDKGASVTTDLNGNVYLTGEYQYTVDFDPGPGVDTMTAYLGADLFVQKFDPDGNYQWAKTIGGHNGDDGTSIAIDMNGDLLVVGNFSGTTDFDPGPGTFVMTPEGQWNSFILKLDDAGSFIWARSVRGTGPNSANAVVIDERSYTYVVGAFQNTVDLDPGPDSLMVTAQDLFDCYTLKLDPNGNMVWAAGFGGTGQSIGRGITIDGAGAVYQTGSFYGTIDFDPTADTLIGTALPPDAFVMKLNDLTTGLDDEEQVLDAVPYPNPTSGSITLDLGRSDHHSIKLYSILGELIWEQGVTEELVSFTLEGAAGAYFLHVIHEDGMSVHRVMKQ